MFNGYKYVIIDTESITIRMLNLSTSNSIEDLRKNNSNNQCILKITLPVNDIFLDYELYSNEEIIDILNTNEEWIQE